MPNGHHVLFYIIKLQISLADPGAAPARLTPNRSQSFFLTYVYAEKHRHRRLAQPPRPPPPQWKILDQPLDLNNSIHFLHCKSPLLS